MNTTTRPTLPALAFTEDDAARAYNEWGCNCGPSALSAALGLSLDAVRPRLGDFEQRGYMNPTMMATALLSAGASYRPLAAADPGFPDHGLVRIQWGGPWMTPGVPIGAQYARTHWIACAGPWIFDINGGVRTRDSWEADIVPLIIADVKRADGTWAPTHRWEVMRP